MDTDCRAQAKFQDQCIIWDVVTAKMVVLVEIYSQKGTIY